MDSLKDGDIVIYALPGSQFCFKVLAAMDSRKIPYFVEFIAAKEKDRKLPSGGKLVPEMLVHSTTVDPTIVPDSEAILQWLDDNRSTNFFPKNQPEASELSLRASTQTMAALVWYYNWANDQGYQASMQKTLARLLLPRWLPYFLSACVVDLFAAPIREKYTAQTAQALGIAIEELKDEKAMEQRLVDELLYFQSFLKADNQDYLLPGEQASAADFSLYAQVERLVGAGTASDVRIDPSFQSMKDDQRFERLWTWHDLMRERFPVQFKGKRIPAN